MAELSRADILKYFEEINNRLAFDGKHGEILLTGGAALTLVFNARNSTRDIDAVFRPMQDMRKIISSIAKEHSLESDWLNDAVKTYVTDKLTVEPFKAYSNLTITTVDAKSLLAMKLNSARFGTKDMDDSIFLMNLLNIKTEKEVFDILDKHVDPFLRKTRVKFFTQEAFQKYLQAP
ncbi:MAG: DUF6036 family nucleotidyltransferase [Defluviitaleaceae bacterium]|nr:DUF6036 family nucleotidyltransferase [Defluviitaleaceae bacterium]